MTGLTENDTPDDNSKTPSDAGATESQAPEENEASAQNTTSSLEEESQPDSPMSSDKKQKPVVHTQKPDDEEMGSGVRHSVGERRKKRFQKLTMEDLLTPVLKPHEEIDNIIESVREEESSAGVSDDSSFLEMLDNGPEEVSFGEIDDTDLLATPESQELPGNLPSDGASEASGGIEESQPGEEIEEESQPVGEIEEESQPGEEIEESQPGGEIEEESQPGLEIEEESQPGLEIDEESQPGEEIEEESQPGEEIEESQPGLEIDEESQPGEEIEESQPVGEIEEESQPGEDIEEESQPGLEIDEESQPGEEIVEESQPGGEIEEESQPVGEIEEEQPGEEIEKDLSVEKGLPPESASRPERKMGLLSGLIRKKPASDEKPAPQVSSKKEETPPAAGSPPAPVPGPESSLSGNEPPAEMGFASGQYSNLETPEALNTGEFATIESPQIPGVNAPQAGQSAPPAVPDRTAARNVPGTNIRTFPGLRPGARYSSSIKEPPHDMSSVGEGEQQSIDMSPPASSKTEDTSRSTESSVTGNDAADASQAEIAEADSQPSDFELESVPDDQFMLDEEQLAAYSAMDRLFEESETALDAEVSSPELDEPLPAAPPAEPALDNASESADEGRHAEVIDIIKEPDSSEESRPIASLSGSTVVESYGVKRLLANDGVSCLYEGKDRTSDEPVAIRIASFRTEVMAKEFADRVVKRSSLEHPNICKVLDAFSTGDARAYVVMEYPEGISLDEVVVGLGRLESERDIASILVQLCDAMIFAHDNEIVHGTLGPAKILIRENEGQILASVLDFGGPLIDTSISNYIGSGKEVTRPECLSPEQCDGFDPQPVSDIYSLGVVAYRLITGRYPYESEDYKEVLSDHRDPEKMPEPISAIRPELINVNKLSQIVYEAMETDPDWRFESVQDLKDNIVAWAQSVELEKQIVEATGKITDEMRQLQRREQKDLRSSVLNMVALKQKAFEQEETIAVQLADRLKLGGRRQSPVKSAIKVGAVSFVITGLCMVSYVLATAHQEEIRSAWLSASRTLSGFIKKDTPEEAADEMEIVVIEAVPDPVTESGGKPVSAPSQTVKKAIPVKRRVRKFRYADSYEYQKYTPKEKASEPIIIE